MHKTAMGTAREFGLSAAGAYGHTPSLGQDGTPAPVKA